MTRSVRYHPEAAQEVQGAVDWYRARSAKANRLMGDDIVVVAVAHAKRKPGYWSSRKE